MMTLEEAQAELMILRGLAESGNDLALVKERVARLYMAVCNKPIRHCNCRDKYLDALLEIYKKLKFYSKHMNEYNAQAKLVNGVVLQWHGNHYTNNNLTDEVAREFLTAYPQRKDWFAILPSASTAKEVVAEVADKPTSTTPKKKKTSKKGK